MLHLYIYIYIYIYTVDIPIKWSYKTSERKEGSLTVGISPIVSQILRIYGRITGTTQNQSTVVRELSAYDAYPLGLYHHARLDFIYGFRSFSALSIAVKPFSDLLPWFHPFILDKFNWPWQGNDISSPSLRNHEMLGRKEKKNPCEQRRRRGKMMKGRMQAPFLLNSSPYTQSDSI